MNPVPAFDAQVAIQSLAEQSGMEQTLIRQKVEEKITKFSGLLTEQGALVLLSKELNAKLPDYEKPGRSYKLNELQAGMNNVDVQANVKIVDRVKTFSKNGKEGKYLSIRLEDETGEALYTFWNEQAEEAVQKGIRAGSMLKLSNARVGNFNQMIQLSLGYNGTYSLDNTNAVEKNETSGNMKPVPSLGNSDMTFSRMQANQFVQARAHVLDVLPGKGYYVKCAACGGKPPGREPDCALCGAQGKVETRLLVAILLDDGTKPVRAVAFENEALGLYGKTKEEILAALDDPTKREELNQLARGSRVDVQGKAKVGMDNTTLELVINRIIRVPFENP